MEGEKMMEETRLDGMTSALHVAAIKGQVLVLRELVRIRPDLARVPTELGETALHLTVKWNHLGALKVLVEEMMNNKVELVNSKDCKGNTVLHVGVSNKHLEIVSYLLTLDGLQVNALNKNGLTALDLLPQSPQELKEIEIERALRNTGASSGKDLHLITHDWLLGKVGHTTKTPSSHERGKKKRAAATNKFLDWPCSKRSTLSVVASLIVTVAFQAGLSLSLNWPDKCMLDEGGESVSGIVHVFDKPSLVFFSICIQCIILGLALFFVPISFVMEKQPAKRRWWMSLQLVIMWIAGSFQTGIYLVTVGHITRQCQGHFSRSGGRLI